MRDASDSAIERAPSRLLLLIMAAYDVTQPASSRALIAPLDRDPLCPCLCLFWPEDLVGDVSRQPGGRGNQNDAQKAAGCVP